LCVKSLVLVMTCKADRLFTSILFSPVLQGRGEGVRAVSYDCRGVKYGSRDVLCSQERPREDTAVTTARKREFERRSCTTLLLVADRNRRIYSLIISTEGTNTINFGQGLEL